MSGNVVSETEQIRQRGLERLEELCRYLLPGGRKEGSHWKAGNINGEPGKSFDVNLATGQFGDWADGAKMQTGAINLWMAAKGVDFNAARSALAQWLGINVTEAAASGQNGKFDWPACVGAIAGSAALREIETWRGYSRQCCNWLVERKLIGLFHEKIAFPVTNRQGNVTSPHWLEDRSAKKWLHFKGVEASPLIIGDPKDANTIHLFESTWDGLAFCDRFEVHTQSDVCVIITRGAKHSQKVRGLIPTGKRVYAWPQNDAPDLKTGKIPSEEWVQGIRQYLQGSFWRVETPAEHADLNDWTRAGATKADLIDAISAAATVEPSSEIEHEQDEKPLRPMPSWIEYGDSEVDRTQYHVGDGFLEVGGFVMLIGQSYVGKSTLLTQLSIYLAIGRPWLFFRIERALSVLIVQAEDPGNKLVKMGRMYKRMGLTPDEIKLADENTAVLTIRDLQDAGAVAEIERHAKWFKADIVIVNPMTSYLGGSVYKDEVINRFLRVELIPMLDRLSMSAIVAHHPPKPAIGAAAANGPKDLTEFELQYGGAGMAALTNAPRGNMFLTHVDGDVFKLSVGKGFDDLGTKESCAYLRRSKDAQDIMLWERCESEQAEEANEKLDQRKTKNKGGRPSNDVDEKIIAALRTAECVCERQGLTAGQLVTATSTPRRTIYNALKKLVPSRIAKCIGINGYQLSLNERNKTSEQNADDEDI